MVFCHLLNDCSGSPMVLSATLEALNARERGLLFVGSQGKGVLDDASVRIRRYWYHRSRHRILTFFTYICSQISLYRKLVNSRDIPVDATIFVNTLMPFAAMIWGKQTGRRVVVHVHELSISPRLLRSFLTLCTARCADLVIYVSNHQKEHLPIDGPKSKVIANPVSPNLTALASGHLSRRADGLFRVLMLASLRRYKGVEEFMALAASLQSRSDITFELVLNADADEVSTFAARHDAADNVVFHSRTGDLASFYTRADLVVNLSRVDQIVETFGLTLIEAMSFGIPVIAPPVGGPVEIVTNGVEGYCIDSRDGVALREALLSLIDNPESYAAMSRAARLRARDFAFGVYATAMREAVDSSHEGRRS